MRRCWALGVVIALTLSACSSTTPPGQRPSVAERLPTVTPIGSAAPTATPAATTTAIAPTQAVPPATATAESDGPVTPSMAELQIGGERYATLGDPNAPLTIVEFTDYG